MREIKSVLTARHEPAHHLTGTGVERTGAVDVPRALPPTDHPARPGNMLRSTGINDARPQSGGLGGAVRNRVPVSMFEITQRGHEFGGAAEPRGSGGLSRLRMGTVGKEAKAEKGASDADHRAHERDFQTGKPARNQKASVSHVANEGAKGTPTRLRNIHQNNRTIATGLAGLTALTALTLAACSAAEQGITTPAQQEASVKALQPGAETLAQNLIGLFRRYVSQDGPNQAEILVNFGWNADSTEQGLRTFGSVDLTLFEPNPGRLAGAQVIAIDTRLIHDLPNGQSTERDTYVDSPAQSDADGGPNRSWSATEIILDDGFQSTSNPGRSTTVDNPSSVPLTVTSLSAASPILADAEADVDALHKAMQEGN